MRMKIPSQHSALSSTMYLLLSALMFCSIATSVDAFSVLSSSVGGTRAGALYSASSSSSSPSSPSLATTPIAPTPVENVIVLDDADQVGSKVRQIVVEAARTAIAERGHFALAIPGGSILKMLANDDILVQQTNDDDDCWTSHTTIAYVNHKCVPMDDLDLATHAKAQKLFMNQWEGSNPIVLDGTDDGPVEATSYQTKLQALDESILPRSTDGSGLPIFDLALIGVGDDGHIGSLYPNREEVLISGGDQWVACVDMKAPPSITLTLPVMANARQVIVAACGVSDKYPQGKSAGMFRAIASSDETLTSFPAVGLRDVATWIVDKVAASKLGAEYNP